MTCLVKYITQMCLFRSMVYMITTQESAFHFMNFTKLQYNKSVYLNSYRNRTFKYNVFRKFWEISSCNIIMIMYQDRFK